MKLGLLAAALVCAAASVDAQVARYRLTVDVTWSEATHPGLLPDYAHLSWLAGGSHGASISFWDAGALASAAVKQMAETGATVALQQEVAAQVVAGKAWTVYAWTYWFCAPSTDVWDCGSKVVELDVAQGFPYVTLASMIGPSPDWFVGVSSLPMRDANGWRDEIVVDLVPYDAGTRDANVFALGGPLTTPPQPIAPITAASGHIIGPAPLGTFTFELLEPVLEASATQLSIGAGDVVTLDVRATSLHAGDPYLILGSVSGSVPGFAFGGLTVPLVVDDYFDLTLTSPNRPPLAATFGTLDANGEARATIGPVPEAQLAGLTVWHSAAILELDPLGVTAFTDAVAFQLVP